MQRRVIGKGLESVNIDKGRVAQKISKPEIRLNLLLFGVQIKKTYNL
jgi:hypothetical protein